MKESKYNIRVDLLHGRSLLFNTLSLSTSILEKEDNDQLTHFSQEGVEIQDPELLNQLLSQGIVIPEHVDELAVVEELYHQTRFNPGMATITICPTLACNFGCDYCFQGAKKSTLIMSEEVQDGIVALFHRIVRENPGLNQIQFIWYGGEPLVRKDILFKLSDRLVNAALQAGLNYGAAMVSNGYFLNRDVAQRLFNSGLRNVQITLDGNKEHHDARRYLLSKKGSYDTIIANLKEWIDEVPIHVNIRVNIDERNKDYIRALIDDLESQGLARKPNFKLYFAPVESVTKGCHNVSSKMLKKKQYGRLEAELYRYAYNHGLANIPYPPRFIGICSALRPNDYIVVPCGSVHKCWDTVSFNDKKIGTVFELDRLFAGTDPLQQTWKSFDPFSHPTCRNCKLLPNCAGFCAHKFIHASEAIGEASLPCPSLKYSIKEKLISGAESVGHITAADYDPEQIRTRPEDLCSEVFDPADYHYEIPEMLHVLPVLNSEPNPLQFQ